MRVAARQEGPVRGGAPATTAIGYVAAFIVAELIGLGSPLAGTICDGVLMLALINHYAMTERDHRQPVLLGLAVVCLYRALALTPTHGNDPVVAHALWVGIPALAGTCLALRLVRDPHSGGAGIMDLRPPRRAGGWAAQYLIAVSGIPLSYAAYRLFRPASTIIITGAHAAKGSEILGGIVVLAIFSGLLEELLFRGLVHEAARSAFGGSGLYFSAAIFGAAYIGTGSVIIIAFVVAVGAFFGWCYERTESVLGVAIAHAIISIGVFMVWPSIGTNLLHLHF
ncbi:MAG: lysostaphin resistance A-like protein [Actinomycetota bacterium]